MRKIIKNSMLTVSTFCCLIASEACALDHGSNQKFIAKARVVGVLSRYKVQSQLNSRISAINNDGSISQNQYSVANTSSIGSGLSAELSGTYFFTNNVALELIIGLNKKKVKVSGTFNEISSSPTGFNGSYTLNTLTKFIPLYLIAQYHIAPYGKISPYIGAGYNHTIASGSAGSTVSSATGPVIQFGFDTWVGNEMLVNADLRKVILRHKLSFVAPAPNGSMKLPAQKMHVDPWILSLGAGYRF